MILKIKPLSLSKFIQTKMLGTRNIFIDKKSNKELVIYFTIYHPDKSIAMLKLYYDEFIEIIEEHEGKKILDGWWLYAR